jgi:hypothetical protein
MANGTSAVTLRYSRVPVLTPRRLPRARIGWLYADDVVLTDTAHDNNVYQGKEQVRTYWTNVSGPFPPEHHWIGYTPAMRIKNQVKGSTGALDFECLWMNVDDNTIGAHTFSSMEVTRVKAHWLVKRIKVGKVDKL